MISGSGTPLGEDFGLRRMICLDRIPATFIETIVLNKETRSKGKETMFGNESPFQSPDNPKVRDAMEMEPWAFCSLYEGEMGETENFWYVCLDKPVEQYVWRKDDSQFQGYHKGDDFSPDFLERIESQKKRIEIGISSGELIPNVDHIKDRKPEEFAKENETTVKIGPMGLKTVVVDDIAYMWTPEDNFVGVQIAMSLSDPFDKENEEDSYEPLPTLGEIANTMLDYHADEQDLEIPNEDIINYLVQAMKVIVGVNISRKEAIELYNHIKTHGGDIDSTPPPPFLT